MSIAVMISGQLAKQPETRQTSKGNPFAFTLIRVPAADSDTYINVTVFDSTLVDLLTRLKPGDPVTVVGAGKLSLYTPANDDALSPHLSVTANRIISLVDQQSSPRPRKRQDAPAPGARNHAPDFNDD